MKEINFKAIEEKWQKKWADKKIFEAKEDSKKKKYYVLEMFPYPSAAGLHMGHALNYSIGDVYARFKRMNGFNVLYPMGFDSFGLPAENAAVRVGEKPKEFTEKAIENYIRQMKELGLSYDWSKILETHKPEYYGWNQYFFLKFLEKGLAYRRKAPVNWCPKCSTVLANEQVHNGKCEYHSGTDVEIRHLEQWFIKTTAYAEELLDCIDNLKWPESIKLMQKNWIGKSYGSEINFEINGEKWPIFTTRPDTIFGVTFMVISAQHPRLNELVTKEQKKDVEKFLKKIKSVSEKDLVDLDKEGVFTGSYAVNPITREKIPVWVGNFVVADYGSGMVMAVPAHDQRDWEFARKYNIGIKEVVKPVFGVPNKSAEFRQTISAVVHRKKDNKFLFLKWKKFNWISPVVGGIEKDENTLKAAEREVFEETGYKVRCLKILGGEFEAHSYIDNKKIYRHRVDQPVLCEIINENSKPEKISEEEKEKHEPIWLTIDEAIKKLTHEYNNIGLLRYLKKDSAYVDEGILINSGEFSGMKNKQAIDGITKFLEKKKLGSKKIQYKLRDWLISRQRYWGTPIPVVYCDKCGIVPIPEKDLPVLLPEKVKFGDGNPLATNKDFVNVKCPKCSGKARRETDTMDTFYDSSWYYIRYADNENSKKPFDAKKADYWLPVNQYIGGAEHACMHLLYARFFTKALRDLGFVKFDEPFEKLFNQGMLHGPDGGKMSKSKGNVINPDEVSKKYGMDTARFFLLALASPDKPRDWSEQGIQGSLKFIKKVMDYFDSIKIVRNADKKTESKLNSTIKEVTPLIENFQYNLAIIKIREFFNSLSEETSKDILEKSLKLLHLFCPHITEELWEKLGNKNFISLEKWPVSDESKIDEKLEEQDELIKKLNADIEHVKKLIGKNKPKVYVYVLPQELEIYSGVEGINLFAVNDKNKYDPEGKSKKTKPGKPAIYLE